MKKVISFTLIELLAVISVFLILASLVSPALRRTIARSEQVQCTNNLKQIGAMSSLYIGDHDGRFTPDMLNWGSAYWIPTLMNLYGDKEFVHRRFNPLGTVFECPSSEKQDDAALYLQGGYGYNTSAGAIATQTRWIERLGSTDTTQNISIVTHPAQTTMFADDIDAGYRPAGYFQARLLSYNYASRFQGKGTYGALGARGRHQYTANYYWLDGHAESMTWDQFITEGQTKGSHNWYLTFEK